MKRVNKKHRKLSNSACPVLVLNKAYMPIDVCTWGDAVRDYFNKRADIVHNYEDVDLHGGFDVVTGEQFTMKCPAVIRMLESDVNGFGIVNMLPLTRKNILDRDKGKCAYCGDILKLSTMTLDHVYPESKGGLSDWANLRASCGKCNSAKGDKTLSELGWTLRSRVGIPTLTVHAPKSIVTKIGGRIPDESWRAYIYWSVETTEKMRDV